MKLFNVVFVILTVATSTSAWGLETVPFVDPTQYLGTWYQIARNPHPFEAGCVCARQVLSLNSPTEISVYNSCNDMTATGPIREIRGTATIDDPATNARLTVDFGLPFKGQYWIVGLDAHYRYAVVSEPSLKTLYVLSKTPTLDPALYDEAVRTAALQLDTSKLQLTPQAGCNYPPAPAVGATSAPTDPAHPGSKIYPYSATQKKFQCAGRDIVTYLPTGTGVPTKVPAVVYGHGQALGLDSYETTLEHLAKKGVAVIFPNYDTGFFDQDWTRMGRDYVTLTDCAIAQTGEVIARDQIVFSGHSKGAYIASIAAGLAVKESLPIQPKGVVLFQSAGFDAPSASAVSAQTKVTVVYSDKDTVVGRGFSDSYYSSVRSLTKQFIFVKSYPGGPVADHYWPMTKGSFFGGGTEGLLHYYGAWKWLVAAALDQNEYIYGAEATDKGSPGIADDVKRNY